MPTTLIRIDEAAHLAGLAAPLPAVTKSERFSLLIKRGVRQEEECRKAYVTGVIDLMDRLKAEGVSAETLERVSDKLIADYR